LSDRDKPLAGELGRGFARGLVDFALNHDVATEIERQQQILAKDPDSAAARLNLGILFYSQGRVEDAIREMLMSIECDPSQGRPYRKLGEIYIGLRDYPQAAIYARMAADRGDSKLLEAFERYPRTVLDRNTERNAEQNAERSAEPKHGAP
jgi:tetratricopeptide (TPR) repeat protein